MYDASNYRSGSCAWSSMGRGYPEGPPRVRAVINNERTAAWRVSDRKVKASLHIEVLLTEKWGR